MADEPFALSTVPPEPPVPVEGEYDAICTAVMATVRGRWFLDEYSRRNRNTDTRAVLAAIERIESVIASEHAQQAQQQHRVELLEMARAIAQTRAEVAGLQPGLAAVAHDQSAVSGTPSDVIGAAQRLQDLAWTMREQGIDPPTSDQIEQLATAILSASSLHNPADRRAQRLAEVLQYLELRIDKMLDIPVEVGANRVPAELSQDQPSGETEGAGSGSQPHSASSTAASAEMAMPDEVEATEQVAGAVASAIETAASAEVQGFGDGTALGARCDVVANGSAESDPHPSETSAKADIAVIAEVESDLGLLTAATLGPAAPGPAEGSSDIPPAAGSPGEAVAEASSVRALQPIADGIITAANPELPDPSDAAAVTPGEPPQEGGILAAARETSIVEEPSPPAPTMWHDGPAIQPEPHRPPELVASTQIASMPPEAAGPAPLPADFLLDPLSPPRRKVAAPHGDPDSSAGAAGNVADIEEDLFAAQDASQATVVAGLGAPPSSLGTVPPPAPMPLPAVNDPLAALQAMSDEERIALFT